MKKPNLKDALATKVPPSPDPAPAPAAKTAAGNGKRTTSLTIPEEMLEELKILAVRQRVRVNDIVLDSIRNHLQLHGRRAA